METNEFNDDAAKAAMKKIADDLRANCERVMKRAQEQEREYQRQRNIRMAITGVVLLAYGTYLVIKKNS